MKYDNMEIIDFTERVTKGGVIHTLYEDMSQRDFENIHYVWLHYYVINDDSHSKYVVWLRNVASLRSTIFKNDCVVASKELRKKINSWL